MYIAFMFVFVSGFATEAGWVGGLHCVEIMKYTEEARSMVRSVATNEYEKS